MDSQRRRGERMRRDGRAVGVLYARIHPGVALDIRALAVERREPICTIVEAALRRYLDEQDRAA